MQSVPAGVSGTGGEILRDDPGSSFLHGEGLVQGETLTCDATVYAVMEKGTVRVHCTLPCHDGEIHYDGAFCYEWKEYES